jgi:hypothetical protein
MLLVSWTYGCWGLLVIGIAEVWPATAAWKELWFEASFRQSKKSRSAKQKVQISKTCDASSYALQ